MKAQIVHLCKQALHAPGSVNAVIRQIVEGTSDFQQIVLSSDPLNDKDTKIGANVILGSRPYDFKRIALGMVPERILEKSIGIGSKSEIYWLERCLAHLRHWRPHVVFCHDIYKAGRFLRPRLDWPCRLILTQHGFAYMNLAHGLIPDGFDTIIYLARSSYEFCRRHSPMTTPSVEIIPNIIDTHLFRPADAKTKKELRKKLGFEDENTVVFAFVSRLVPKKGIRLILEAWHEYAKTAHANRLEIIGGAEDPNYLDYLRKLAGGAGHGNSIRFHGVLPREQFVGILQASDIFVFPTLWPEGMGLALFEALSCGLTSIVARWPVLEEFCEGADVLWVDIPNNISEWVSAMKRGVSVIAQGTGGEERRHEWVKRHYSREVILPRWREVFRRELDMASLMV
jgi:glycosyltransferase involved in cell wall biosynthesis